VADVWPNESVTVTSTTPAAPAGEVTVMDVADLTDTLVPAVVPNDTVSPAANPVPVIVTDVPPATGPVAGLIDVTVGAAGLLTVSVAAFELAEPNEFVNTARYWLPLWVSVVPATERVVDVAPLMFANVVPPSVDTCHCTVGAAQLAGVEPAAVNVAVPPTVTVALAGCVVIDGADEHTPL
jgi:hypothetical protein